jgi:glycosyltransferase involved in cell wall biosynthesis
VADDRSTSPNERVSVVVPTKNSARTIGACLASIGHQTHDDVEVVVVDNFSSDGTPEIAREHDCQFLTVGPERSAQRNHGARHASGSFLLFVDSDMVLETTVVEDCVAAASSGATAVIVPEVSFGEGFWARCRRLERTCYLGDDDIEAARFFTRELFFSLGGYDEDLGAGEDWDLSQRARAAGAAIARGTSLIHHDEGRLALTDLAVKKFRYGKSLPEYRRKHRAAAGRQFRPLRSAFLRHGDRLTAEPVLLTGIAVMKSVEFAAGMAGAVSTLAADRLRPGVRGPRRA